MFHLYDCDFLGYFERSSTQLTKSQLWCLIASVCAAGFDPNRDPNKVVYFRSPPPDPAEEVTLWKRSMSVGRMLKSGPPSDWKSLSFDDSNWADAPLPIGYDDYADYVIETPTTVADGTVYVRFRVEISQAQFDVSATAIANVFSHLKFIIKLIDVFGALLLIAADNYANVWLNDAQVSSDSGTEDFFYWNKMVDLTTEHFVVGTNLFAFEVVNTGGSSDHYLDWQLEINHYLLRRQSEWRYAPQSVPDAVNDDFDDNMGQSVNTPIGYNVNVGGNADISKQFGLHARSDDGSSIVQDYTLRMVLNVPAARLSLFDQLTLRLIMDDWANVYVNEVLLADLSDANEDATYYNREFDITLNGGRNVIAVLGHGGPSTMMVDLDIIGSLPAAALITTTTSVTASTSSSEASTSTSTTSTSTTTQITTASATIFQTFITTSSPLITAGTVMTFSTSSDFNSSNESSDETNSSSLSQPFSNASNANDDDDSFPLAIVIGAICGVLYISIVIVFAYCVLRSDSKHQQGDVQLDTHPSANNVLSGESSVKEYDVVPIRVSRSHYEAILPQNVNDGSHYSQIQEIERGFDNQVGT